jgi:hypothetical protein
MFLLQADTPSATARNQKDHARWPQGQSAWVMFIKLLTSWGARATMKASHGLSPPTENNNTGPTD